MAIKLYKYSYLLFTLSLLSASLTHAHGVGPEGMQPLDWHTEQISQVISFFPFAAAGDTQTKKIAGRHCMTAPMLNINVLDEYAYDIDETVEVEVEFDLHTSGKNIEFYYDKNGGLAPVQEIKLPEMGNNRWYKHTFTLERARFAGRYIMANPKFVRGDFSIRTRPQLAWFYENNMTVCGITVERSYTTPQPAYGRLVLKLLDESGNRIPARVGIYNETGRMPLPEIEAIPVSSFSDITRTVILEPGRVSWPTENRYAFYVNGSYHARLPVGKYNIVVARGLEYRILQQSFLIESDKETSLVMKLSRWTDMSANGWYSGDVHIHYGRNKIQDNHNIHLQTQAEDLNVANLLQAGNIGATYFRQYDWGVDARYGEAPYTLVSGQEDPRTVRLDHTIQLNINESIRNPPERYYLYHEVFEEVRKQGGLTGYAHMNRDCSAKSGSPGLALDGPYKLVSFIEILQAGEVGLGCWFDFLNLGYKISPAAGTDYPYHDVQPGAVRNYVEIEKGFSTQAWFDGLKAGRTFVTNGPMLELTVNGKSMGSTLQVKNGTVLTIIANATINPDIDQLDRIELYQQGEIVANISAEDGVEELRLKHKVQIDHGTWFVLKAQGKQEKQFGNILAVSAPVYVTVDDNGFCKLSAIPSLVALQKDLLQKMLVNTVEEQIELEPWDTWKSRKKYWPTNKNLLEKRVEEVNKKYDELVTLANKGRCVTN